MIDRFLFIDWGAHVFDINGKYIALILKNGTRSLHEYCRVNNHTVRSVDTLHDCKSIDVYMRNPVDRYFSGLTTVRRMNEEVKKFVISEYPCSIPGRISSHDGNVNNSGFYFDSHQYPQYWFFLQAYADTNCRNDLQFNIYDISDLSNRLVGNLQLNMRNEHPEYLQKYSISDRQRVKEKYWIDTQIYQKCLGKTLTMLDILNTLEYTEYTKELAFFDIIRKGIIAEKEKNDKPI